MNPALVPVILTLVAQYGPGILAGIEALFQKNDPTVADINAIFAGLQPYSAFGIPSSPPVVAAPAAKQA